MGSLVGHLQNQNALKMPDGSIKAGSPDDNLAKANAANDSYVMSEKSPTVVADNATPAAPDKPKVDNPNDAKKFISTDNGPAPDANLKFKDDGLTAAPTSTPVLGKKPTFTEVSNASGNNVLANPGLTKLGKLFSIIGRTAEGAAAGAGKWTMADGYQAGRFTPLELAQRQQAIKHGAAQTSLAQQEADNYGNKVNLENALKGSEIAKNNAAVDEERSQVDLNKSHGKYLDSHGKLVEQQAANASAPGANIKNNFQFAYKQAMDELGPDATPEQVDARANQIATNYHTANTRIKEAGKGAGRGTPKQFSDVGTWKQNEYDKLEKQAPLLSPEELLARKQGIENSYSQKIRSLGGQSEPYQFTGNETGPAVTNAPQQQSNPQPQAQPPKGDVQQHGGFTYVFDGTKYVKQKPKKG